MRESWSRSWMEAMGAGPVVRVGLEWGLVEQRPEQVSGSFTPGTCVLGGETLWPH